MQRNKRYIFLFSFAIWSHSAMALQPSPLMFTSPADSVSSAIARRSANILHNERTIYAIAQLYELHFWVGKTYSPKEDANRQAIIAFQKLYGLLRTGLLMDSTVSEIMHTSSSPTMNPIPNDSIHAYHLEIDLDDQVLLVVDSTDRVVHILPVSTGTGQRFHYPGKGNEYARTPRGKFKIYHKVTGWKKSPLGIMFDPMYITGGFAVHGEPSVPTIPGSHGCIRLPMFAADELFRTTPAGTEVIIYGKNPEPLEK
jgi:lipoprotein-anchoring transpeptidase ErfK/SrfK